MTKFKQLINDEVKLLWISTIMSGVLAIVGIILAVISNSLTLLIDGIYCCIDFVISILSIVVVKNINRPADRTYNFGYNKFEPLISSLEGISIIILCVIIFFTSIQDIVNPKGETLYGLPIIFTSVATVIGFFISYWMLTLGKKLNSNILVAGGVLWKFDAIISAGVFVGFVLGHWLQVEHYNRLAAYVDPIMSIILIFVLIRHPFKIIWYNIRDLLDINPGENIENVLTELINQHHREDHLVTLQMVKVRKAGRKLFINVQLKIIGLEQSLRELQLLGQELRQKIQGMYPNSNVDIVVI